MSFCWSMVATRRRSGFAAQRLWWITPLFVLLAFTTVAESMSIPLRDMILQWSETPGFFTGGYQRSSRSFNMGADVVHEKPRPLRFG